MIEPAAAINSALGLLQAVHMSINYISLVINAENNAQKLINAASTVQLALKQFIKLLDGQEGNSFGKNLCDARPTATKCLDQVESILKKLELITQGGNLIERIIWPFSNAIIKQEVEGLRTTAQLLLNIAEVQQAAIFSEFQLMILERQFKILERQLKISEGQSEMLEGRSKDSASASILQPENSSLSEQPTPNTIATTKPEAPANPAQKPKLNDKVLLQETDSRPPPKTQGRIFPHYCFPPPPYTPEKTPPPYEAFLFLLRETLLLLLLLLLILRGASLLLTLRGASLLLTLRGASLLLPHKAETYALLFSQMIYARQNKANPAQVG
ncbi:hypothetical protein AOQ84DRAFT_379512 [Glonium stellatum]|uniref:Uncharacterized protein n=1 Tax=Glonium stellatum TaxID=574774 RepID=A0A8E2JQ43_9PEZI|nr:hypothetical protein AOQ84DRAFT_379512 [Glonium stellatum]